MTTLTTHGRTYELGLTLPIPTHPIWIVRIMDEFERQITVARIAGTQDQASEAAGNWLAALLGRNPGQFMRYTIQRAIGE